MLVTTTWGTVVYPPRLTIESNVKEFHAYPLIEWMDFFSRHKFEYVWRNILMDSSLLDEEFYHTVGKGGDGEFEVEGIEVELWKKKTRTTTMTRIKTKQ